MSPTRRRSGSGSKSDGATAPQKTSVTPFSLPVCDRAVHAVAVGLIRCLEPSMREHPGTGPSEAVQKHVKAIIRRRLDRVAPSEIVRAEAVLDRFFRDWINKSAVAFVSHGVGGNSWNHPLSSRSRANRPITARSGQERVNCARKRPDRGEARRDREGRSAFGRKRGGKEESGGAGR